MSFEAFRRNITVTQEEVDAEVDKELKEIKASFDRKQDKKAYAAWIQETFNEAPELFEN
jgi:predicted Zn-dependent peptidase